MRSKQAFHPFTTLAVALAIAAVACMASWPLAAAVLAGLAYGATLLEFKTYTSRFQFIMLVICGALLGGLLDHAHGLFPFITVALIMGASATCLRQAYMPVFTYVRYLWMEPVMLASTIALWLIPTLNAPFAWDLVALPLLPILSACLLAFGYVQDGILLKRKARLGYRIQVGGPAPDFELPDQDGRPVRLSEYRGKHPVLLIFVRGDWCPGCHMMLRTYERNRERFHTKGIHVLGVGPDSIDVNKDMVERIGVGYRLLSDSEQRTSQRYGVVYGNAVIEMAVDYAQGIPLPASFLVDIDGIVRYVSRPDRVGEFLDPALIFNVLEQLPDRGTRLWEAA